MQVLRVCRVVHDGNLDGGILLLCVQIDDIVHKRCAAGVNVAYKVAQTTLAVELLGAYSLDANLGILVQTHIGQCNADAGIQVSQFAHTVCQSVILVCGGNEYTSIGPELLACTTNVCIANNLYTCYRLTL